ncbi:MAG: hypothetical protein AMS16_05035 [Planctomycetes bacterium DG_58]|nr:MAG: hypothetical protein AMS16_05035 [Planctomycetes bacterium DG_58]KPK98779.1 MAG: hypothetical protein AMK75_06835 [Planctomycetes bacterium SM23_65]
MTTQLRNHDVETVGYKRVTYGYEPLSADTWGKERLSRHIGSGGPKHNVVVHSATFPGIPSDGRAWVYETLRRVEEIAQLPTNWDGDGSPPSDPTIIVAAEQLLTSLFGTVDEDVPVPDVVPVSGGGFQFEWTVKERHLEIEFASSRTVYFLRASPCFQGPVIASGEYPIVATGETRGLLRWLLRG